MYKESGIRSDKSTVQKRKRKIKHNLVELDTVKEEFIKYCKDELGYTDKTIDDYINYMKKTQEYEIRGKYKNFENFSKADLVSILRLFGSTSLLSLITYKSCFENFFDFAIKRNLRYTDNNPANEISIDELRELIVDNSEDIYITREGLHEILKDVKEDPSSKFLVLCIFEGIRGKGSKELSNLTEDNFNESEKSVTFTRTTKDGDVEITLVIEDEMFWETYEDVKRYWLDFYVDNDLTDRPIYIDNKYIFKPFKNQKDGAMRISDQVIFTRVKNIFVSPEVNRRYITPNSLYISGLFDRVMEIENILLETGKIKKEFEYHDFKKLIAEMKEQVNVSNFRDNYDEFKDKFFK